MSKEHRISGNSHSKKQMNYYANQYNQNRNSGQKR